MCHLCITKLFQNKRKEYEYELRENVVYIERKSYRQQK